MNSEQLRIINKKNDEMEKVNEILGYEYRLRYVLYCKNGEPFNREASIAIPVDIIDTALIIYRDKLKAELKELGYEE